MSHQRKTEDKRRLKLLNNKTKNYYGSGAFYDEDKGRYIRCYRGKNRHSYSSYLRKRSARAIRRRMSETSSAKGFYRKHFDYWWELY